RRPAGVIFTLAQSIGLRIPDSQTETPMLGIEEVRAHRGWSLFMGVALIVLGLGLAIFSGVMTTEFSVLLLGPLLIFTGLFEVVHGFARRAWRGFFINLAAGSLHAVTGLLLTVMVWDSMFEAITFTLMI